MKFSIIFPASSCGRVIRPTRTVGARRYFTEAEDGLAQPWPQGRIWLNPPYAGPVVAAFVERFIAECQRGSCGMALVNNATETGWFQSLANAADAVCFHRGRIRFRTPNGVMPGQPLQGQTIIYIGPDVVHFAEVFAPLGVVTVPFRI